MTYNVVINRALVVRVVKVIFKVLVNCWALFLIFILISCFVYYLLGGFVPLILLALLALGILYNLEDHLLYHPELPPHSRLFVSVPSVFGLPYESVYTRAVDGTLVHLFVILQQKISSQVPTVLYFHGNAGNVGHRLQNVVELYQNLQCNIVMLEYRGYGLSQGKPSEHGLYLDAKAALDYIASRKELNHREIILFGRSLGGAVAIDVSIQAIYADRIWCLVVENSFTSIPEMAKVLIGWRILKRLPVLCYKNKFLSLSKVDKLKVPTLFISGQADTLVPPRMMMELHQFCSSSLKKLVQFQNGTHNETWQCPGYYNSFNAFLHEVRQRTSQLTACS